MVNFRLAWATESELVGLMSAWGYTVRPCHHPALKKTLKYSKHKNSSVCLLDS